MWTAAQPRTGCWLAPSTLLQHQRGAFASLRATLHIYASFLWRNLLGRYNEQLACTGDLDSTKLLQDLKTMCALLLPSSCCCLSELADFWGKQESGGSPQKIFRGNGKTAWSLWISPVFGETRNSRQVFRLTPRLKEWIFLAMTKVAWDRLVFKLAVVHNRRKRSFNELFAQPKF